jgi:threonine dehydrogenase-like Zn-dependent dehydrogenase
VQAVTLERHHLRYRTDYPEPEAGPDEVIVDVIQGGICETDLQLRRGYMGFSGVLGHEFVGIARAGRHAGQRVVGEINCACRLCPACRRGLANHCPHRTVIGIDRHDGAFADKIAVPEANLHPLPESVSNDEAVFVEPLAAAFQIGRQVDLEDARVAVLGDGRLAMMCVQAIRLKAEEVTVVGKHSGKLARFRPFADRAVLLEEPLEPKSWDVVVDCTGSESGMPLALQLVRPRGTVVMKTTVAGEHRLSLAAVVIDEITVVGSRCGPFDEAIDALQRKLVDVASLITHRFPLRQAEQAMEVATDSQAMKVVLEIHSPR